MKHLRPISVAKASDDFGAQLLEPFLADLTLRFWDFIFYRILGFPEPAPTTKETCCR